MLLDSPDTATVYYYWHNKTSESGIIEICVWMKAYISFAFAIKQVNARLEDILTLSTILLVSKCSLNHAVLKMMW